MKALLSFKDVTVKFGGLTAVNEFSMDVEQGAIHALIGPNGAGKSTVLNCVSRFCYPAGGDISVDGQSLLRRPSHAIVKAEVARTFQNIELLHRLTVLENVLVGLTRSIPGYLAFLPGKSRRLAEAAAVRQADEILEKTGLSSYRHTLSGELDFGHQKMLDLARALAGKPKVLLLDEPAAGLRNREIANVDSLLRDLRKGGVTILLVEHVMQLVMSVADRITVLNFGKKIAEGPPSDVRHDPKVIEAYLGGATHA